MSDKVNSIETLTARPADGWMAELSLEQIDVLRQAIRLRLDDNVDVSEEEPSAMNVWDAMSFSLFPVLPDSRTRQKIINESDIIRQSWQAAGDYLRLAMLDYEADRRKSLSASPYHQTD